MTTNGNFNYFYNNESKTKQEIINLIDENSTVSVDGLNVFYSSPKKDFYKAYIKIAEDIAKIYGQDGSPVFSKQIYELKLKSEEIKKQEATIEQHLKRINESSTKTDKILKCVNEHQNVNGRELNVEFPFDFCGKSVIEEAASKREKIKQDYNTFENRHKRGSDVCGILNSGIKESEGKLNYELDWEFIQQLAERMSQNKDKYAPNNWKLEMNVESLKQSLFRHVIEVMKGNYSDSDRTYGHLESIALNALFINYQLKNNKLA